VCGIVGIYSFDSDATVDTATIAEMCGLVRHRGPDDEGTFVEGGVGVGMRRLSVIDLNTGHQPVFNEDGSLLIVFNGEIYNYRDLRSELQARGHVFRTKSDTETILHAYEEYGPECVRRLNGMFGFAIFDRRKKRLFIARDHIGIKPLYYVRTARKLLFASEIKAILNDADVPRRVNRQALVEYMNFGYVSGDQTLFDGIEKLPAAHYMLVDATGITIRQYWSLPEHHTSTDLGLDHYAEQVRETLKAAVRRQLVSDVPLGAFLSGGMDSSSIVHMMRDVGVGQLNTYAIGFGDKHRFHDELKDAKVMAERHDSTHHEIVVEPDVTDLLPRLIWHLDEPVADSSYIVTYLVSQLAAQSVKVILSGVGGDELFGGYRRYLAHSLTKYLALVPGPVRRGARGVLHALPASRDNAVANFTRLARTFVGSVDGRAEGQYATLLRVFNGDILADVHPSLYESPATFASDVFRQELAKGDLLQRMQSHDIRHSLVDDLLLLTDKMTMACSLESRVPLLDIELVELAYTIPSRHKISGFDLRKVQKQAMKDLLPTEVLKKKKKGFGCPVGAWVKTDLHDYIQDSLASTRLARHGLFDAGTVGRMLKSHYASQSDHTDQLMSLLTFEIWYDTFIGRAAAEAA
jgi:asparagine synthase (glutamine-hydrolysing)